MPVAKNIISFPDLKKRGAVIRKHDMEGIEGKPYILLVNHASLVDLNLKCAESIDIDTGLSGLWGFLNLWIGLSGKYREALYNGGLLCYNEKTVKKSE